MKKLMILMIFLLCLNVSAQALLYRNSSPDTAHITASMNATQDTMTFTTQKGITKIEYWSPAAAEATSTKLVFNSKVAKVPIGHLPPDKYIVYVLPYRAVYNLFVPDIVIDGDVERKIIRQNSN